MVKSLCKASLRLSLSLFLFLLPHRLLSQTDTLRAMTYNVLYYGDRPACQGPHMTYHNYLKTIVAWCNPDVLGLVKMAAIPMYSGDHSGTAPTGFGDSILQFALNAAFSDRYAYCTYTNSSAADDMAVLFYDKHKLGFCGIVSSYVNVNDFNTYKLYYKSTALATSTDTVFLYVTLNHTQSGSGSSSIAARAAQLNGEMALIQSRFTQLPNMLNMGDFNFHSSTEAGYQTLVAPSSIAYKFYDPPFYPDALYNYPADWDANPATYAANLTTSTRKSSSVPNSCGTNGGGKSWYDHIFVSGSIVNNTMGVKYLPHTYRTIGNDGNRTSISVNDLPVNTSAPAPVIDAVFQMSNKYPVMVDLLVSPTATSIGTGQTKPYGINVANPVSDHLTIYANPNLLGTLVKIQVADLNGRYIYESEVSLTSEVTVLPFNAALPGLYVLKLTTSDGVFISKFLVKE